MNDTMPHYLLFSETGHTEEPGKWRFVLRAAGSVEQFEACDQEPGVCGERLELLTVVRALESLDRPSRVTLMTPDPYIRQGLRFGLPEWRNSGWQWEFYGRMVPVKHSDLWQRMDRAMEFHQIELSKWRIDRAHRSFSPPISHAAILSKSSPHSAWARLLSYANMLRTQFHAVWFTLDAWWRGEESAHGRMSPCSRMG
jgi:ribonuclease HI